MYWQLITFPLNASVNNAWQSHKWVKPSKPSQLDLLGFTQQIIGLIYFRRYSRRTNLGRPMQMVRAVDKRVRDQVLFDGENHFITSNEKQSRCGQCKNARLKSNKCKYHCIPIVL